MTARPCKVNDCRFGGNSNARERLDQRPRAKRSPGLRERELVLNRLRDGGEISRQDVHGSRGVRSEQVACSVQEQTEHPLDAGIRPGFVGLDTALGARPATWLTAQSDVGIRVTLTP